MQSMLTDFFHSEKADTVNLAGLEHVLAFTATTDNRILLRVYKVLMMKSGTKVPRIELSEIGPSCDFTIGRSKWAADDVRRDALKVPKESKVRFTFTPFPYAQTPRNPTLKPP